MSDRPENEGLDVKVVDETAGDVPEEVRVSTLRLVATLANPANLWAAWKQVLEQVVSRNKAPQHAMATA